jgi:hypothetical protein
MARQRQWNNDYSSDEHLTGENDDRIELTNSAARADTIRAAIRFISDKSAEIKALREELSEYKQTHIKGDLGMKLADWAVVYRVSQLAAEDRGQLFDTLREGFRALNIGGTVDWVSAAREADERKAARDA